MAFAFKDSYTIDDLKTIMQMLRGENGCPWDKEQDHHSIRKNFIEETYEVIEAIDQNDSALLKEELGDVLLQIVFHAQMEAEMGHFQFDDVVNDICHKLIIRHPHIFGNAKVNNSKEVLENWANIKQQQKGQTTTTQTLHAVPKQLPALMRSSKVQERAKKAGFDYPDVAMAFSDLQSEVIELQQAMEHDDLANIHEEIGDVIFSCVNVARFYHQDAEELLTASCNKFIERFHKVEVMAKTQEINMKDASIETLIQLWNQAKH